MKLFADKKKWNSIKLFLFILPFLILVFIFSYYPLYGWVYAFYDYRPPRPFSDAEFVGLKWFKSLVENDIKINQLLQVLKNTFAMSAITLGTSWLPMFFAVFLNEIKCVPFRKFVQTVTTLPNFISWVLVYSVAFSLFNSTGMINTLLTNLGLIEEPILLLQSSEHVWLTQWLWLTWKNLGWSAIMYIAGISSIDDELFQAAKVDGATRMQIIRHITIPSLLPTFFVLLMMNIGNFLSNGMEQYYVFQNAMNQDYIQVLDLYVYNQGIKGGQVSYATAIGTMKSLIALVLFTFANILSKKVRGTSVF